MEQRGETFKTEEVSIKCEHDEEDEDRENPNGEVHNNPLNNRYIKLTATCKKSATDNNEKEINDECQLIEATVRIFLLS